MSMSFLCRPPPATRVILTLSLHDALPIFVGAVVSADVRCGSGLTDLATERSFTPAKSFPSGPAVLTHEIGRATSELQSPCNLVCRLLLEKKKSINARSNATLQELMITQGK